MVPRHEPRRSREETVLRGTAEGRYVNRQTKRLLAKQKKQEERAKPAVAPGTATRTTATGLPKKQRTPPKQFLREVRGELKKVAWPSRGEVTTYTVVVLVSTVF